MAFRKDAIFLILVAALLSGVLILSRRKGPSSVTGATGSATALTGAAAAAIYCQSCHLLPDPATLDRRTWKEELLPKMSYFTGLRPPDTNYFRDLEVLLASNVFSKVQPIPREAWEAITDYYVTNAPEKLISPQDQSQIRVGLNHFSVVPARHRLPPAHTTLTRIDPARGALLMGDAQSQALDILDREGNRITSILLGNIPVSMAETERGFYVAGIGHFFPREERRGQVLFLEKTPEGLRREEWLSNLPRTTDVKPADFNGDGREDIAVCMYGNFVGRFSWFENTGSKELKEHLLLDQPGALSCAVHDFDRNGSPDLAVLVAQALESMFLFLNDGKGHFTKQLVLQRQPSWGHSGFELTDFNSDGRTDLLMTNGDNADFSTSPTKPYHGIRIFLQQDNLRFEERWFFHMNGAYKALARDFDKDGDLDIAATSFFPDYEHSPRESFVYLENQGEFRFEPSTFRECVAGRWLTLDAGDLDGDGYDDLALGSLIRVPTPVPPELKKIWEEQGPSVVILRNTAGTRRTRPN